MTTVCSNNKTLPLRFTVMNFQNHGEHRIYGSVITSVRQIEMGQTRLVLRSLRGQKAGVLHFVQIKMDLRPSLLSYMQDGWKISVGVAIDFTLSNRPISDPRSHHR